MRQIWDKNKTKVRQSWDKIHVKVLHTIYSQLWLRHKFSFFNITHQAS